MNTLAFINFDFAYKGVLLYWFLLDQCLSQMLSTEGVDNRGNFCSLLDVAMVMRDALDVSCWYQPDL